MPIWMQDTEADSPSANDHHLKRDVSLSMEKVNVMAIPIAFLPVVVVCAPFLLLWGSARLLGGGHELFHWYVIVPALVGGIVVHELLHGIAWAMFGKKSISTIRFGISWKTLTPFAHCSEPMSARAYRWGAVMPGMALGAIPALYGLLAGSGGWALYGMIFLIAATGDFIVLWVIRGVPATVLVEDHPHRAGCFVYDVPSDRSQDSVVPDA